MQIIIPVKQLEKIEDLGKKENKVEKRLSFALKGEDRNATLLLPADYTSEDLKRVIKILGVYVEE